MRTRQYNPAGGAQSAEQWALAIAVLKGWSGDMSLEAAREIVRETPARKRSEFAREIQKHRRPSGMATMRALLGNPANTAADLAEAFHGRPSIAEEFETAVHQHTHLAGLGTLDKITLKGGVYITFDSDVILASNESGTQLFIEGGDQEIDLDDFPEVDDSKESVVLGQVKWIYYTADKVHLSKAERKPSAYKHRLGEESGDLPFLIYDTRNRLLSFSGGHYYVGRSMAGGYSEGVVD